MPESPRAAVLRLLRAEWPLLGAAAALLSLLLLPRLLPSRRAVDDDALSLLRLRFERREYPAVDEGALDLLTRAPERRIAAEAHALRGRAALARLGPGADPALAGRAWAALGTARRLGFAPAEMLALQRDAAHAILDAGRSDEAASAFRELLSAGADPRVALDLGRVLAARAARRPRDAAALAAEILDLAETCRRRLPPERRLEPVLAAARLARRAGRGEDALPVVLRALDEAGSARDRGLLQLERGRTLTRLDRKAEALAALDLADELLRDAPETRAARALAHIELHLRGALSDVPALVAALDPEDPGARRLGRLLEGLWRLGVERPRGLHETADALAEQPSLRALEDAGLDLAWIHGAVRAAALAEDDPAALARGVDAFRHLLRLEPEEPALRTDLARALRRLGELLRRGDPAAAARRWTEAAEAFEQASLAADQELRAQEDAAREGADAYLLAERPVDAARLYRRWYEFGPRRNAEGLLRQARALKQAGLLRGGALDAYADYVGRAGPGDPGLPEALLERGRLLAELGDRPAAVAEFDRLLKEDLGLSPETEEWEAALLGRGRAQLEIGLSEDDPDRRARFLGQARRTLAEYIERYAEDGAPRAGVVEASYLLARAAMELRDWTGATDALARAAAADPADDRARSLQREARFLRGDLYFAAGRYDEAERAYAEAMRRHAGSPDRLWGVVGRARALARLGRLDEARREARGVRALYEQDRAALEASFAGRGRDFWIAAIEALEKEVR